MLSATTSSDHPRVLLVDDSEAMIENAAAALDGGFTIVGAVHDGPSALSAAGRLRPDVIVLDISMPGMGGLEVASRLKASGSTAKVVFFTIHDDEDLIRAAKAAGGLGYVLKPRVMSELPQAAFAASAGRRFISATIGAGLW